MARDTDALIIDAVRSPIGKKNGTLSHIRGDDLSAQVVNGLVARPRSRPG
jgi:Thiolase, N-terminal domain.